MTVKHSTYSLSDIVNQKKKELKEIVESAPKYYHSRALGVVKEVLSLAFNQEYSSYKYYYDCLNDPELQTVASKVYDNIGTQFNKREKDFALKELLKYLKILD